MHFCETRCIQRRGDGRRVIFKTTITVMRGNYHVARRGLKAAVNIPHLAEPFASQSRKAGGGSGLLSPRTFTAHPGKISRVLEIAGDRAPFQRENRPARAARRGRAAPARPGEGRAAPGAPSHTGPRQIPLPGSSEHCGAAPGAAEMKALFMSKIYVQRER